ncbi:MAG: MFS transporter [Acidobacteria bacterium]|nr:MFS transporter [Acidobacteriota bacterium]
MLSPRWTPWGVVLACSLGVAFSLGTLAVFSFSLFLKPLVAEFHWSRGEVSLAGTLINVAVSLMSPFVGRLADSYGSRAVTIGGHVLLAAGLCTLALLNGPLWQLYAVFLLIGIFGSGATPPPYSRVVAKWFTTQRGLALGLVMAGGGLGTFVMPHIVHAVMDSHGWRGAYVALGFCAIAIPVPLAAILIQEPQPSKLSRFEQAGMTRSEALRSSVFYHLTIVFFLAALCTNAAVAHLAPILTDQGMQTGQAAMAVSLFGLSTFFGRLVTGWLVDKLFAPYVAASLFALLGIGLLLLRQGAMGELAAVFIGFGFGAEADIMPYLASRYFGFRAFGEIYGILFASFTLGIAAGPPLMGFGFDRTGGYAAPLGIVLALMAAAVMGVAFLPPFPGSPERIGHAPRRQL